MINTTTHNPISLIARILSLPATRILSTVLLAVLCAMVLTALTAAWSDALWTRVFAMAVALAIVIHQVRKS